MKSNSPENYGRYPAHADIIAAGAEGRDAFGHRYGRGTTGCPFFRPKRE